MVTRCCVRPQRAIVGPSAWVRALDYLVLETNRRAKSLYLHKLRMFNIIKQCTRMSLICRSCVAYDSRALDASSVPTRVIQPLSTRLVLLLKYETNNYPIS